MNDNVQSSFILKGHIIYSQPDQTLTCVPNGYLVCKQRKVQGVYSVLPTDYAHLPIIDHKDSLIIPGMTDLHVHAPQYTFRGLGMDLELIDWLNTHTFPEEAKYQDVSYAKAAYRIFANDLLHSTTTRACIFATLHEEATLILMDALEKTGLRTLVGKVNMDRNGHPDLEEESATASYEVTRDWIIKSKELFSLTQPIITPRFIPTCSDELMTKLQYLQDEFKLPLQSHLSENLDEIEWVKSLSPASSCYGDAYARFNLFGGEVPTVMAHCVYSSDEEVALMKEKGVYIAHCPESNINLSSGIAPIRHYLDEGLHIGLGSDVAGGSSLSLFKAMAMAIQASKLYYRLVDTTKKPLTSEEAFYLATLGGGSFFGKVGSFLPDYDLDAVIIDDSAILSCRSFSIKERLERALYYSDSIRIVDKYVAGHKLSL